jgi:hypothetical protein
VAGVANPGGGLGDRVEDLLHACGHVCPLRPSLTGRRRIAGAGEIDEVVAFGLVELQSAGDAVQDGVRVRRTGCPVPSGRSSRCSAPIPANIKILQDSAKKQTHETLGGLVAVRGPV